MTCRGRRKFGVAQNYILWELNFPTLPATSELARELNFGCEYAAKVISAIRLQNEIIDPASTQRGVGNNLTPEEDLFLLSLHVEIRNRSNLDYF
jgi:hypothetical protein